MEKEFKHRALRLNKKTKVIFIGMSKYYFFFRRHAVKFVLNQGFTPISQFGIFDYFIADSINRDLVRRANNNLIRISDEFWVIGPVSDGVLAEIKLVKEMKKPIKYFKVVNSKDIKEIPKKEVEFEEGLKQFSNLI
ncbi:MAG: hypothetical protein WDK96_02495 [Candidatus Paceibacterota bacterium]|jgi:hypothetical protein